MSTPYDDAKKEYDGAKGKLERLGNLRISLAAEEWGSERERKRWIAEKEQLEREEEELKTNVEYWKGEMKRLTTSQPAISSKRTLDDLEREYGTRIAILEAEHRKIKYTITAAREIGEYVISEAQVDTQYILNLLSTSGNVSFEKLKLPVNFHKLPCTSESDLQVKFVKLFQSLPEQMKPWGIRDTSVEGYLKDPIGKIDFTIIQGNMVLWVHVVSLIEIKSTLNSKTSHCEALGQLIDRFTTIFDLQKNRSFIIGAICGDSQVEFVWQNREKNIKRSDLLDLSFTSQTIGMNMLLNMVTASQMQLGYSPPEDYKAAVSSVSHFSPESVLRPAVNERGSFVLSGFMNNNHVILKVCDVDHEIKILHHLCECDFIPKVITYGNLPENKKYMVMTPFGEHLDVVKHGWHGILKAFQDVAEAMKFANNHGILHRDISYGNIVFYEQHGYLIDWGVAVVGSPEVENALTGTILFSSVKVTTKLHENKKFTHTFDDDIESLFYTFLYVACDGVLKWKKGLGGMDFVAAMKFYTVYGNFSKQLKYVKNNELLPYLHGFRDIIVSNWTDKMAIDIDAVIRVFDIK